MLELDFKRKAFLWQICFQTKGVCFEKKIESSEKHLIRFCDDIDRKATSTLTLLSSSSSSSSTIFCFKWLCRLFRARQRFWLFLFCFSRPASSKPSWGSPSASRTRSTSSAPRSAGSTSSRGPSHSTRRYNLKNWLNFKARALIWVFAKWNGPLTALR